MNNEQLTVNNIAFTCYSISNSISKCRLYM